MWEFISTDVFDEWYLVQEVSLREYALVFIGILEFYGPQLGRSHVDTLKATSYPSLEELRIQHSGDPVRAFFAIDLVRPAIILCGGDKTGLNEKKLYRDMIRIAETGYRNHLDKVEK